jgi:hypothetical protein
LNSDSGRRKELWSIAVQRLWELEEAREIPAEVFGVRLSEVDEMIRFRIEAENMGSKEDGYGHRSFDQ